MKFRINDLVSVKSNWRGDGSTPFFQSVKKIEINVNSEYDVVTSGGIFKESELEKVFFLCKKCVHAQRMKFFSQKSHKGVCDFCEKTNDGYYICEQQFEYVISENTSGLTWKETGLQQYQACDIGACCPQCGSHSINKFIHSQQTDYACSICDTYLRNDNMLVESEQDLKKWLDTNKVVLSVGESAEPDEDGNQLTLCSSGEAGHTLFFINHRCHKQGENFTTLKNNFEISEPIVRQMLQNKKK